MCKKIQIFVAAVLFASTITAVSGNISFKESHSGSFLHHQNTESLLYCDFGFDVTELYL